MSASKVTSGGGDDPPLAVRGPLHFADSPKDRQEFNTLPLGPPLSGYAVAQYRSPAGDAMNAIAALQVPLASLRCGLMQSPTLPNVAVGQN